MSESPERAQQLAALVPSLNATIDRLTQERNAAEDRFVKMRQEVVEQEDEIARLTAEIDTRKTMFARLQEEYDAAKPYIVVPSETRVPNISRPLGALFWCVLGWAVVIAMVYGAWHVVRAIFT